MNKLILSAFIFLIALVTSCFERSFVIDNLENETKDRAIQETDSTLIKDKVKSLILATIAMDPEKILSQVHLEKGANVDIKAAKSYGQIKADIFNKNSFLYLVLFDTVKLRNTLKDPEIQSIAGYLSSSRSYHLHLTFYSSNECEVFINFQGRPSTAVLGNPVYEKIDGDWYLRRIF